MSYNNGKITAPIAASDPYNVMGVGKTSTGYDVGYICSNNHGKINKWSKHKPVRINKISSLTDDEFKGTTADNINGIIYGLMGQASATNYLELHNITYEYVGKPVGGSTEPFRLSDFDGYDHNAKCNLNGVTEEDGSTIYFDIQYPLSIYVDYDYLGTNKTGVNLSDFTDSNDNLNIEDYYPCIMIDNYAKALYNSTLSETTSNAYTPIKYNGAYYSRFRTDITLEALKEIKERKVSFFLIKKITDGFIDLRNWVDVSDKAFVNPLIAIPEATGLNYKFDRYYKLYYAIATMCRKTTNGFSISWEWEDNNHPNEPTEVTFRLDRGDVFGTKTVTYTPPTGGLTPLLYVNFTWAEVGLIPLPSQSVNIAGYITPGNRQFNFTIIA